MLACLCCVIHKPLVRQVRGASGGYQHENRPMHHDKERRYSPGSDRQHSLRPGFPSSSWRQACDHRLAPLSVSIMDAGGPQGPLHGCAAHGSRDNAWQRRMPCGLCSADYWSIRPSSLDTKRGFCQREGRQGEAEPPPAATPLNECGCYRDAQDQCHCNKGKKLKCACEGDCEPAGCEEQRRKQQEKDAKPR